MHSHIKRVIFGRWSYATNDMGVQFGLFSLDIEYSSHGWLMDLQIHKRRVRSAGLY